MKKKLLLILALAALTLCSTACEKTDNEKTENPPPVNENSGSESNKSAEEEVTDGKNLPDKSENAEKAPDNKQPDAVQEAKDAYSYVAEPGFEIVDYLESSEYVIYTVDGEKLGICDTVCKVIIDPGFTAIGWCPEHRVVYAEPFPEGTEPIVISDKYRIDVHYGHGGWGAEHLIFDNNTSKMFKLTFMYDSVDVTEVTTLKVNVPYINYTGKEPISEGTASFSDGSGIYEKLDGIVFGKAEYEFVTERGSIVSLGECESIGSFVNDYMAIRKDGFYGFVDLAGQPASEFIYDAAIPAHNGKAWVKSEGIWKVVELG